MSFIAEVMEAVRYTEAQNQLILARNIPLTVLAKRFGKSVRRLERQRKLLIELENIENEARNKPEHPRRNAAGAKPGTQPGGVCTNAGIDDRSPRPSEAGGAKQGTLGEGLREGARK